jgi:hypothetical protein
MANAKRSQKNTSKDIASRAAKLLGSGKTSDVVKSVAGSALVQAQRDTPKSRKAKKPNKKRPASSFKAGKDL